MMRTSGSRHYIGGALDVRRHILLYDPVRLADGNRIHLFKLDRGALENELEAHDIAERLKERLRSGYRLPDVVIMEGEPMENPRLFGSDESVARIKSMLA